MEHQQYQQVSPSSSSSSHQQLRETSRASLQLPKKSEQYEKLKREHPEAIIWETSLGVFRHPVSKKEHEELEEAVVDSFHDNFRYLFYGVNKEQTRKRIELYREWEIKYNNRWGLYDYETGQLKATGKVFKGDLREIPELTEEMKLWENMIRADAIMDECKKRAKENYPEYFKNPGDIMATNGGTITKPFRGTPNIVSTTFQSFIIEGFLAGFKYTSSVAVDPRVMAAIAKNGGKMLAEVFYDEPGHLWSIDPQYFKKVEHICKQYENGRPSVRFYITDIINHEAVKYSKL